MARRILSPARPGTPRLGSPRLGSPRLGRPMRSTPRPGAPNRRPSRTVLVLLLMASFTIITLDVRGGADSPVEPLRSAAGEVFGPVEQVTTTAVRPFVAVPEFFRTTGGLRNDVARLQAENSRLRTQVETSTLDRNRAAELDGLLATSKRTGYALVPARMVAMGPAQAFSRTVTIDAGRNAGLTTDMTVLNNDGLVGRVVRTTRTTATVLLIVDRESVVGGRVGSSMEVGFLRGRGDIGGDSRLDLDLADSTVAPAENDVISTWGSRSSAPYVSGIPIGRVSSVQSSPRQLSAQAVIEPFVDFTALDLVGVVVDDDTRSDRSLIEAGRSTTGGDR